MAVNLLSKDLLKITTSLLVESLLQFLRLRHLYCKEGEKQESSMAISFLSEDLLIEILARLPVKSLLRFRSVSKSWRDIIKEPTFIAKHHITQVASNRRNCLFTRACFEGLRKFCLLTDDERGVKCTRFEPPFLEVSDVMHLQHLEVAGPCNGLVIILDEYYDLFLCNPATREYKVLPRTSQPRSMPENRYRGWCRVGFGIDPITKDYKVVRIWNYYRTKDDCLQKAEVFSLSANSCRPKGESWKIIDVVPPILLPSGSDQVYLNGKYYWCDEESDGSDGRQCHNIVWFDMGAQVFGLIELPIICSDPYWNKLGVLNESLAMVRHAYKVENKYMYQIWIMDEEELSWTKYATVGPFKEYEVPLGFWKNHEMVVLNSSPEGTYESFSYDIKTHVIKDIMQGMFSDKYLPLPIYNESLVSVVGED